MSDWWRRIRGALGLGVVWAGGGAFVGGLVELISNLFPGLPLGFIDMWIPTLALPGFLGGVSFAVALGIAGRRRRFDELSYPRVVTWGIAGGVLLGTFMMIAMGAGPLIFAPAVVLSAVGASLSLAFARLGGGGGRLGPGDDPDEVGLSEGEERELLG